jgi:hypothetical protein
MPDNNDILLITKWKALADKATKIAITMMNEASDQFCNGIINEAQYDEIHNKVKKVYTKAYEFNEKASQLNAALLAPDIEKIENVTKDLLEAIDRVKNVKNSVKISIDAIDVILSLLLVCTTQNPASILAVFKSASALVDDINKMNHKDSDEKA